MSLRTLFQKGGVPQPGLMLIQYWFRGYLYWMRKARPVHLFPSPEQHQPGCVCTTRVRESIGQHHRSAHTWAFNSLTTPPDLSNCVYHHTFGERSYDNLTVVSRNLVSKRVRCMATSHCGSKKVLVAANTLKVHNGLEWLNVWRLETPNTQFLSTNPRREDANTLNLNDGP